MLAMDKIHFIRQLYYEQGKTIPEIIVETGHDRKTIIKYLDMTDFNTPEPKAQDPEALCPKLDPYKPVINEWLNEDKRLHGSSVILQNGFITDFRKKSMILTVPIVL